MTKRIFKIATVMTLLVITSSFLIEKIYDKTMKTYCAELQIEAEENKGLLHYYVSDMDMEECGEVYGFEINYN